MVALSIIFEILNVVGINANILYINKHIKNNIRLGGHF